MIVTQSDSQLFERIQDLRARDLKSGLRLFFLALCLGFPLLIGLIYGNEALGSALHLSLKWHSPAVFALQLPSFSLKWYAIFLVIGFICAFLAALRKACQFNTTEDDFLLYGIFALVGGALGARLYYVALQLPYYMTYPEQIFSGPGLTIHGCILGVCLATVIFSKVKQANFLTYCDMAAMVFPLAQAIWRCGNFFNSEAFGHPLTDKALVSVVIPPSSRPTGCLDYQFYHPAFFYELAWDLGLFVLLYAVLSKKLRCYPGMLTCCFIVAYSLGRSAIECIRLDSVMLTLNGLVLETVEGAIPLTVSIPLVVSELSVVAGVASLFLLGRSYLKGKTAP